MKLRNRKTFTSILLLLLGTALTPSYSLGEGNRAAQSLTDKTSKKVEQNTQDQTAEKRKKIMQEASSAIAETQNALKALDGGKTKEALAALERSTGKLEIILAREPKLALAPTSVHAITHDVLADVPAVKSLTKEAEDLIDDGRIQEARHLIRDLASETVISVTNIPLATYPVAIKEAVRLIDDKKEEEAKRVLQTALNTLVVTNTIIPLPVARAEESLREAEKLSENKARNEDENKRLGEILNEVRSELEFAQALGYGTKRDFKNLYDELSEIEKKTEGGKSGVGFFDKIKLSITELFASSQSTDQAQSKTASNQKGE